VEDKVPSPFVGVRAAQLNRYMARKLTVLAAFRILAVNAVAAFVGATAFLAYGWILFGFDIPNDLVQVYLFAFLVSVVASLVFVPLFILVQRFAPAVARSGLILAIGILGGVIYATIGLTQWKRFTLDLPELVGRAWNVYLYFVAFGATYGASWIILVSRLHKQPAVPAEVRA
jgi:hypothetical protein